MTILNNYFFVILIITMSRIQPVSIRGDFNVGPITAIDTINTVNEVTEVVNVTKVVEVQEVNKIPNEHLFLMEPNLRGEPDPISIYARGSLSQDWATVEPSDSGELLQQIPESGTTLAFSIDNDSGTPNTTCKFIIEGYATSTSIQKKFEIVTCNSSNKVLIPGSWYRITDFLVDPLTPSLANGEVYIYDQSVTPDSNGSVDDYYWYIKCGSSPQLANKSEIGMLYSPPNKITIINSIWITVEKDDEKNDNAQAELVLRLRYSPNVIFTYDTFINIGITTWQINKPQLIIPKGGTLELIAKSHRDADLGIINVIIDAVQVLD